MSKKPCTHEIVQEAMRIVSKDVIPPKYVRDMNKIEPQYVTFEMAKLLKEKGFDVPCQYLYVDGTYRVNFEKEGELFNNKYPSIQIPNDWCLAPEIWQVVEWLRLKYGIWIQVNITRYGIFYCNILENQKTKNIDIPMTYEMVSQLNDFTLPQKAYLAAFDYVLKELI